MMKLIYFFIFLFVVSIKGQSYVIRDPNYTGGPTGWETFPYLFTPNGTSLLSVDSGKLIKKNQNGSYDSNFGINGFIPITSTFSNGIDCVSNDQDIYTFKYIGPGWNITKYNINGVLDLSYGIDGTLTTDYNFNRNLIFIDSDSNLYLTVSSANSGVKKILSNGQVDSNFNFINGVAIRLSKSYLYANTLLGIIRRDLNGNLDTAFGYKTAPFYLGNFYLNEDTDEVITFSRDASTLTVNKFNSNWEVDENFGINGVKTITPEFTPAFSKVDFDSDGNILFFGGYMLTVSNPGNYPDLKLIMRLKPNGEEDYTFNNNSFYFLEYGTGFIIDAQIVAGDKFRLINKYRYTMGSYKTYLSGYIRMPDLSTPETDKTNLLIYPNPIKDILNIKLTSNEKLEKINIYSVDGRLLFTGKEEKSNVKFLPVGNYVLEVRTNKNTYNKKLLKK